MKFLSVTIQMKATEQYFPVVLCIMLHKVVLTFEFVDEILKCDHSIESFSAVLFCFGYLNCLCTAHGIINGGSQHIMMNNCQSLCSVRAAL